jgi:hypothetical protein
MFPDKFQAIIAKKPAIEIQEVITTDTGLDITSTTTEAPLLTGITSALTEMPVSGDTLPIETVPETQPEMVVPQELELGSSSQSVTVSGLGDTEIHPVANKTGEDDTFDPFAEVEKMLDEPNPYQDKIDVLENFLSIGQEYNDL